MTLTTVSLILILILILISIFKSKIIKQVKNLLVRCQSTVIMVDCGSSQIKQKAKPLSEMPSPPAWPIVGHIPLMMKKENKIRTDKMLERLREDLGDIYRMYVPGQGTMVVLFRPEDIKLMFANEGKIPQVPAYDMFEFIKNTSMKDRYPNTGLLTNTEDWYNVRRMVQHDMLRPKTALSHLSEIEEIALELTDTIDKLKDNDGTLDITELVQEYALEAVGCVFLGTRLGTMKEGVSDGKLLIGHQAKTLEIAMSLFFLPTSIAPYLPMYHRFVKYQGLAFDICKKHVDEAIVKVKDTDETVIARFVRKCGKDSTIPMLVGIDALQAGLDTTGSTAAFLLYHLANNPDKQELLYQEICDHLGPKGKMTESALGNMKYMKACQTESQRIIPALFGSSRRAGRDIVIGGYHIPKGTTLVRCGSTSSNDPVSFPNPEQFIPERWLIGCPERHTTAHAFANIPFGSGTRNCLGQRFAKLSLNMMMVKLLQRYHMEYSGEEVGPNTQFVTIPDKPISINFFER